MSCSRDGKYFLPPSCIIPCPCFNSNGCEADGTCKCLSGFCGSQCERKSCANANLVQIIVPSVIGGLLLILLVLVALYYLRRRRTQNEQQLADDKLAKHAMKGSHSNLGNSDFPFDKDKSDYLQEVQHPSETTPMNTNVIEDDDRYEVESEGESVNRLASGYGNITEIEKTQTTTIPPAQTVMGPGRSATVAPTHTTMAPPLKLSTVSNKSSSSDGSARVKPTSQAQGTSRSQRPNVPRVPPPTAAKPSLSQAPKAYQTDNALYSQPSKPPVPRFIPPTRVDNISTHSSSSGGSNRLMTTSHMGGVPIAKPPVQVLPAPNIKRPPTGNYQASPVMVAEPEESASVSSYGSRTRGPRPNEAYQPSSVSSYRRHQESSH